MEISDRVACYAIIPRDSQILEEVTDLMERLEQEPAQEVDVARHVDLSVGNIVTQFLFKFRFSEVGPLACAWNA